METWSFAEGCVCPPPLSLFNRRLLRASLARKSIPSSRSKTATRRFCTTSVVWESGNALHVADQGETNLADSMAGNFSSQWKCHIKRRLPLSFRVGSPGNGFPPPQREREGRDPPPIKHESATEQNQQVVSQSRYAIRYAASGSATAIAMPCSLQTLMPMPPQRRRNK